MNEDTSPRASAPPPAPTDAARSILFTPFRFGALELKNRFVSSATVECLASADNHLTPEYLRVYTRLAEGGVGLIIPGNYFVSMAGRVVDKQLVLDRNGVVNSSTTAGASAAPSSSAPPRSARQPSATH